MYVDNDDFSGGDKGEDEGATARFSHGTDSYYHNIIRGDVKPGSGDYGQEERYFSVESCNPSNATGKGHGILKFCFLKNNN